MRIAVYRHVLGLVSEPYIANQAEALEKADVRLFCVEDKRGEHERTRLASWALSETRWGWFQVRLFQATRRSWKLKRELRRWKPDLVLAHFAGDGWRVAHCCRALRIPLVVVVHGSDVLLKDHEAWRLGRSAKALARRWPQFSEQVSLFLPASEFLAERLVLRGVSAAKIKQHYLGIPVEPNEQTDCADKRWDVIYVGRLEENKGCAYLLRAFSDRVQVRDLELLIVGDGSQRAELEGMASQIVGAGVKVTFVGATPPDRTAQLMRQARILCVPSVETGAGASEGFGLVSIEAQSLGVPVVAYATGGLPETLVHGETGFLVPMGDVEGLGEALTALLMDEDLISRMGVAGRRRARELFDLRKQTEALRMTLSEHIADVEGHASSGATR